LKCSTRLAEQLAPSPTDDEARLRRSSHPHFLKALMKYVEKHYTLRVHRRNGTSKLLLGVKGNPRKLNSVMELKLTKDEVIKVKIVDHPRPEKPGEAIEV
jgi:hypothetical protein